MPIDPNTGIYQESQGSPFPGGTFGGALQINNNQIAQSIANENAAKRQLALHLAELEEQKVKLDIDNEVKKQGWADDEHTREALFRQRQTEHPEWETTDLLREASRLGVPDAQQRVLGNLVVAETNAAARKNTLEKDYSSEARQEAQGLLTQGLTGKDVADLLEPKYAPKGVPKLYFDKLRMVGTSPLTGSIIDKNKAKARKDNNTPAKPAIDVDKELRSRDEEISKIQMKIVLMDDPRQKNEARRTILNPKIQSRNDFAIANKRPVLGAPSAPTPVNPSPPTTTPAPPPTKKYSSPDEVKKDVKGIWNPNGALSLDEALSILKSQFGMVD